jgi:RNA-binding protein
MSVTARRPYNVRMLLTEKQKKHLRKLAHPLSPIIMLGNAGLTDGVVKETERALHDHELVKISARLGTREARNLALAELAQKTCSELVQRIGNVGVLFRRRPELSKIVLPDH